MKNIFILLSIVGVFAMLPSHAQRQGIKGEIFWVGGNQMPGPGKAATPKLGAQREVHIYKVTTVKNEGQTGPFFNDLKAEFVTKLLSKDDGSFKVKLLPGEYSVFVKESRGLFANLIESNDKINPVTVQSKRFAWLTITVDYEAVY